MKVRRKGRRSPKQAVGTNRTSLETAALIFLGQKEPSARELARLLRVSVATVHRIISTLRRQGERIVPVRDNGRWHYELRKYRSEEEVQNDPLLKMAGFIKDWKDMPDKSEDEIIYGSR